MAECCPSARSTRHFLSRPVLFVAMKFLGQRNFISTPNERPAAPPQDPTPAISVEDLRPKMLDILFRWEYGHCVMLVYKDHYALMSMDVEGVKFDPPGTPRLVYYANKDEAVIAFDKWLLFSPEFQDWTMQERRD